MATLSQADSVNNQPASTGDQPANTGNQPEGSSNQPNTGNEPSSAGTQPQSAGEVSGAGSTSQEQASKETGKPSADGTEVTDNTATKAEASNAESAKESTQEKTLLQEPVAVTADSTKEPTDVSPSPLQNPAGREPEKIDNVQPPAGVALPLEPGTQLPSKEALSLPLEVSGCQTYQLISAFMFVLDCALTTIDHTMPLHRNWQHWDYWLPIPKKGLSHPLKVFSRLQEILFFFTVLNMSSLSELSRWELVQEATGHTAELKIENQELQKRVVLYAKRRSSINVQLFQEGQDTEYQAVRIALLSLLLNLSTAHKRRYIFIGLLFGRFLDRLIVTAVSNRVVRNQS